MEPRNIKTQTNMYTLRSARKEDEWAIRGLIYRARLNPLGLDWRRFLVAVDENGLVLGCGQIKPHGDGTQELASIVVKKEYRGQGIGQAVICQLLAENKGVLYLTCRSTLGPYYSRFGFQPFTPDNTTPYFQRLQKLAVFARWVFLVKENMLIMRREA